jgi:hypothetical protein
MEDVPNNNVAPASVGPPNPSSHVTVTVPVFASTTVKGYERTLIVCAGAATAAEAQTNAKIAAIITDKIIFFIFPPCLN